MTAAAAAAGYLQYSVPVAVWSSGRGSVPGQSDDKRPTQGRESKWFVSLQVVWLQVLQAHRGPRSFPFSQPDPTPPLILASGYTTYLYHYQTRGRQSLPPIPLGMASRTVSARRHPLIA